MADVPKTLVELIHQRRPADDSSVFVTTASGEHVSYGEAFRRSAQLANLFTRLGVRPGDRLAVQVEKSVTGLMIYLACVRAGIAMLPLNTGYTESEVEYLLGDAEPALVIRDPSKPAAPGGLPVLTLAADGTGQLDELARQESTEFIDHQPEPHDLAAVLYTSGTTGRPKGAMLTHQNLTANALALHQTWGFQPDDVLLHALPIYHVHGLFIATNCVLASGSAMVFLDKFDVKNVMNQLQHCTVLMGVPTFFTRLLNEPSFSDESCRNVRLFISGSAPLLATTHEEFEARTGKRILERYGMTETSIITSNPLNLPRKAGTVGLPLPDVDVRIVDQEVGGILGTSMDSSKDSAIGGVEVRGPSVFSGYWKRPDLTTTEFTDDGFFRTGDVGRFDSDGYLELVGRSKDLIITGGLNVYPKEIEDVIDAIAGIDESAVIAVPDPDFGEAVAAVVVLEPGDSSGGFLGELANADQTAAFVEFIRTECRKTLASFKVPKYVHIVESLPRNAMGKVEKAKLRQQYGN